MHDYISYGRGTAVFDLSSYSNAEPEATRINQLIKDLNKKTNEVFSICKLEKWLNLIG